MSLGATEILVAVGFLLCVLAATTTRFLTETRSGRIVLLAGVVLGIALWLLHFLAYWSGRLPGQG